MKMVWHDDKAVYLDIATNIGDMLPFLTEDRAQCTEYHFTVVHHAEKHCLLIGA